MTDGDGTLPAPREPGPAASLRLRDDEAAAILRRASRRSLRADLPEPHDLTIRDLMEVAEEVGLDGEDVRRAAAVRPSTESATQHLLFGGPTTRTVHATTAVSLPTDRGDLARASEAVLERAGDEAHSDEQRWIWEAGSGLSHHRVALRRTDDGTEVEIRGNRSAGLVLTYASLLVGLGAISGSVGLFATVTAAAGPLVALLGLFGIPLVLARPLFRRLDPGQEERMEQLAMELLRVLEKGD